jgi:peptide-methionine (S)-S-oxide reductase
MVDPVPDRHAVLWTPLRPPFPDGSEQAMFAMGCFWGGERRFWELPGVYTTAVGYTGGTTPDPTDTEVESGSTGHAETVLVAFDPAKVSYDELLRQFWEGHDPTQGMRQADEVGTHVRSAIYWLDESQRATAQASLEKYAAQLKASGYGEITTEITKAGPFYYAADDDQQYLEKVAGATCAVSGTGVACPIGVALPDLPQG